MDRPYGIRRDRPFVNNVKIQARIPVGIWILFVVMAFINCGRPVGIGIERIPPLGFELVYKVLGRASPGLIGLVRTHGKSIDSGPL